MTNPRIFSKLSNFFIPSKNDWTKWSKDTRIIVLCTVIATIVAILSLSVQFKKTITPDLEWSVSRTMVENAPQRDSTPAAGAIDSENKNKIVIFADRSANNGNQSDLFSAKSAISKVLAEHGGKISERSDLDIVLQEFEFTNRHLPSHVRNRLIKQIGDTHLIVIFSVGFEHWQVTIPAYNLEIVQKKLLTTVYLRLVDLKANILCNTKDQSLYVIEDNRFRQSGTIKRSATQASVAATGAAEKLIAKCFPS